MPVFTFLQKVDAQNIDSILIDQNTWHSSYVLDTLVIDGDTHFPLNTVRKELNIDFYQKQTIDPLSVEQLIGKIIDYYLDQGFPFCKVAIRNIIIDDSLKTVSLFFYLETGKIATISFIKYNGLKSNKASVLDRQARFTTPFIFEQKILDAADQYLYFSELFNEYPTWKIVKDSENQYGIMYQLSEEKYNSLDAVLGYSQKNNSNSGLRGRVEFSFKNLLGTLRQLKIKWQRLSETQETIDLYYREPWLLNIPLAMFLGFTQDFQNKNYLERYYNIGADYQIDYNLNLLAEYTYGEIIPDSILINQGELKATKQIVGAGVSFKKSNRQKEFFSSDFKLSSVLKIYENSQEDNGYQLNWRNEWRKRIAGPFYLQQQLYLAYVAADSLSTYDLLKFGGYSSLRGYFESQYQTDFYTLLRNNIIWQAANNTELFLFGDISIYNTDLFSDFMKSIGYLSGSGVGLRFNNNLGTFEISYAIAVKEGFDTAKLHFQYINEF